jgi:hypothetical protein
LAAAACGNLGGGVAAAEPAAAWRIIGGYRNRSLAKRAESKQAWQSRHEPTSARSRRAAAVAKA